MITNNLNVAAILSGNPDCEVIVAGGIVRSRDRGIVGEMTVDFIKQINAGAVPAAAEQRGRELRDLCLTEGRPLDRQQPSRRHRHCGKHRCSLARSEPYTGQHPMGR